MGRTRLTGGPDVQFDPWGVGAGNAARVDLVFEETQYAYRLSNSGTVAPARPPGGPSSGGWTPTPLVPNATESYLWVSSRTRPTGPQGNPFGPWSAPEQEAEWQGRSIWIAVGSGSVPATPTVNYASTPTWSGPGIGSGWYRFPAPHLITQEQDDALDFYSSSQSRVTPGSWSSWGPVSEFHPAVRPIRPPVP